MKKLFLLLITTLTAITMTGCNELKKDKAPKSGVQIFNTNYIPTNYKVSGKPDSMVAFLWPSKEYYERYSESGLIAERNYQSFISQTSEQVFLSGDSFDELSLEYINRGKKLEAEIATINEELKPIIEEIESLKEKLSELNKSIKKLQRVEKTKKRTKTKLRKEKKELETEAEQLQKQFVSLNCADVIADQTGPNLETCKELEQGLLDVADSLAENKEKYDLVVAELDELATEIKEMKEESKPLFAQKKKVEREQRDPLNALKEPLENEINKINLNQAAMLGKVQAALDPHAASFPVDEDGQPTYDQYGNQIISINEEQQVNWIKLYSNKPGQSNLFDIQGDVLHIQFNEWGENKVSYKTSYKKDENGKIIYDEEGFPVLASNSDFSHVRLGARDYLEFNIKEKDTRGNYTGRIYEFKMQRSPFDKHVRILGDMVISYRGEVLRRGQMKLVLEKIED